MASEKTQILYWNGFSGRAEGPAMMLADADEEFEYVSEGMPGIIPKDSFACPVLIRKGVSVSQTPAILAYLGRQLGYSVSEANQYKALQTLLDLADIWSESYTGRKEADKGQKFLDNRLARWFGVLEATASASEGPYFFGDSPSSVDFSFFNVFRSLEWMYGPRWDSSLSAFPHLKASVEAMQARPKLASFLKSTRPLLYASVAADA